MITACTSLSAADAEPPCAGFTIPNSEDLATNSQVSQIRDHYQPLLFQPEWQGWPWLDLSVLALLLILGGVFVARRIHVRRFWIPAAITFAYFGWVRGGCICPVGSVANITIGLAHPEQIGISTSLMFLLPLLAALLVGRVFCSSGCPIGALQHLLGGRRKSGIPPRLDRVLRWLPVAILAATAWFAYRASCMLVCMLDPYKTLFFQGYNWLQRSWRLVSGAQVEPGWHWVGDLTAWGILLAALLAGWWVYRPFCRFICPYGVLLGAFSALGFKRRTIMQDACSHCGACEKQCPVHAISKDPKSGDYHISNFHCIQCNQCTSVCRKPDRIRPLR